MLSRLRNVALLIGCLSLLTTAYALPSPSTLHDKMLRDEAKKRRKATPTPTPLPVESYAAPDAATATTATTSTRQTRAQPVAVQSAAVKSAPEKTGRPSTVVVIDAG